MADRCLKICLKVVVGERRRKAPFPLVSVSDGGKNPYKARICGHQRKVTEAIPLAVLPTIPPTIQIDHIDACSTW
jgi:hypothetical protein